MNSIRKYIDLVTESVQANITKIAKRIDTTREQPFIEIHHMPPPIPFTVSQYRTQFKIEPDDNYVVIEQVDNDTIEIGFDCEVKEKYWIDIYEESEGVRITDGEGDLAMDKEELSQSIESIASGDYTRRDLSGLKNFLLNLNLGFSEAALNELVDNTKTQVWYRNTTISIYNKGQLKNEFIRAVRYKKSMDELDR